MEEVPADVLFCNILSRLPPKSLLRFTSVSKQWQSFLRTPAFVKMQLHHQNHHKLVLFSTKTPRVFQTIDCEAPHDLFLTSSRSLPFKVRPAENMSIVASLHGMVCVAITKQKHMEYSDLILWNPLTGDHKTLSKPSFHIECLQKNTSPFGLYYSSSDDDYWLVHVTHHPNLYIYSLKSDSWRKVELADQNFPRTHNWISYVWSESPSVLLNEKLYFLRHFHTSRPTSILIICFDPKTEMLKEIATPLFTYDRTDCLGFMVLKGCIHLFANNTNKGVVCQPVELWRLDGDKDWTKVATYCPFSWFNQICHIMRNGNWLMHRNGYVYQLDVQKHTKNSVYSIKSMDILGGKYIETIVSPNQYIKGQEQKARDWMRLWPSLKKFLTHGFWSISNNI